VRPRACVCILFSFYLFSSCAFAFATFEQVLYPPLSACRSVRCKLLCRLRTGNSRQYVVCECVLGRCVFFVLLMKLIFSPHDLVPLLWHAVSISRSPWHFMGFISSYMTHVTLSRFCLAHCLLGASFIFKTLLFMLLRF
jgi:hypothetical protein